MEAINFEACRKKYKPEKTRHLFISEAPPKLDSKRFFYYEQVQMADYLFLETMKVLYPDDFSDIKNLRQRKGEFLRKFQREGFYLIDASNEPMKDRRRSKKKKQIKDSLETLIKKVRNLIDKETKIILICKTVYEVCHDELKSRGFNVLNENPIPFPIGHQIEYREKLKTLLRKYTMSRTKSHKKNIACLESLWDKDIENRLSVSPILELVSKMDGVKYTYLTCSTIEEFKYNLTLLKRKRGYGILYLAFHGSPGKIILAKSTIEIETLATFMGKGFKDWIIHFGSCGTIGARKDRIKTFIKATDVSMVLGYKKDVDWIDSAALDLLILDWLQEYKDMNKFWRMLKRDYKDLISITALKAFHK